jgi:cytochrome b subunit of formate dehydrogenase
MNRIVRPPGARRFAPAGLFPGILLLALAAALPSAAAEKEKEKECQDCHAGQDRKAPVVKPDPASPHAELECAECHSGVTQPCHKGMKVQPCRTCHDDQASALAGASHAAKLVQAVAKGAEGKEKADPAGVCRSCHSEPVHAIRKAKDPESPVSRGKVAAGCLTCHGKDQAIAVQDYLDSIHRAAVASGKLDGATCIDCHGSHAIDHSQNPKSRAYRLNIPATCGHCHKDEKAQYLDSIHWKSVQKGFREPPVCTDCHGEHGIRSRKDPDSPVFAGNVTKTCAACHALERLTTKFMIKSDRVESFKDSFHGLSMKLGDVRVAHCASFHGAHQIQPSSDPRSSTFPANLGKTCGGCHPGAAERFAIEKVHSSVGSPSHWLVGLVRTLYVWMIVLVVGGMVLHNLLDLRFKAVHGEPTRRRPGASPRFTVNERLQHACLALSFIVLAVSGFALKFPDSLFWWPFQGLSAGADVRRWSHRVAAGVFLALAVYHALYLLLTARGRAQLRALWPQVSDATDALRVVGLYLRGRGPRPTLPAFGYVEKAEYWALAWGSVIMTVTGAVLLFVNLSLSNLPLWGIDLAVTIHYMEAILAGLAILVWHGYWIVFDPEIYPLNLTFLIGEPRPAGWEVPHAPAPAPPVVPPAGGAAPDEAGKPPAAGA